MVKSLLSILFAGLLLVGAAVFEGIYLKWQFSAFGEEVAVLIQKAEEGEAGEEDGKPCMPRGKEDAMSCISGSPQRYIPHRRLPFGEHPLPEGT